MESMIEFVQYLKNEIDGLSSKQEQLKNQFKEILNSIKQFKENRDDPYFVPTNKVITSLFDISWLEEIKDVSSEVLQYLLGMYFFECLNFETFRSIIRRLYSKEFIDHFEIIASYWVYMTKNKASDEEASLGFSTYLEFSRELGIVPLKPSEFQEIIAKLDPSYETPKNEENELENLESYVKTLTEREEYIEEISSTITPFLLDKLDYFVSLETLNLLSYNMTKNLSLSIKLDSQTSIAEFQKKIEREFTKQNFPIVPTVVDPILRPHLSKIKAKTVKMEDLSKYPSDLVKEFASIKAYSSPSIAHKIRIIFLGGGGIGNMGIIIQHDNNAILLDYGMSVANNSIPRWHPSLNFVNTVLVTHAHLDHTGALPYLISSENKKRWYGSPLTKILAEKLLYNTATITKSDNFPEESRPHVLNSFLSSSRLINLFNSFNPLKPKETIEISPGFEVTPHPASHLYGSYSYEINIFGKRLLFTGDFSKDPSELFPGAKLPTDCDVTIFDGTYYNREFEEEDPNTVILNASENSEKLIIPAFSLGRTQEMIKRLERLRISKKKNVKTTGLAADITKTMGIKADYDIVKSINEEDFVVNDIVVAGHGMMQAGTARNLINATKDDNDTGILICGYQAPNTLGHALKTNHPIAKQKFSQRIFSAHISGHTTPLLLDDFIGELSGKKIMVHTPKFTKLKKGHKDLLIPSYLEEVIIKAS